MEFEEISELIDEFLVIRREKQELKRQEKLLNEKQEDLKVKLLAILEETGEGRIANSKATLTRVSKLSVKTPQDSDAKESFFQYLRERGLADMLSVHSQTLNSWYKKECEWAEQNGKVFELPPGLDCPTEYYDINVTSR